MSVISKNKFIIILLLFSLLVVSCQQAKLEDPNVSSERPLTDPIHSGDTSSPKEDKDVDTKEDPAQDRLDDHHDTPDHSPENDLNDNDSGTNDPQPNLPVPDEDQGQDSDVTQSEDRTSVEKPDTKEPSGPVDLSTYHIMNLHINQPLAAVISSIGEPLEKYTMQSDPGYWTVHEYDGFIVGFNTLDQVEFIEVYSDSVNTQLGDNVRVGSPINVIIGALGEPYTKSSYVLNYRNNDITLKFDLDPIDETIISIKLFADN